MTGRLILVLVLSLGVVPSVSADTLWNNGVPSVRSDWCNSECFFQTTGNRDALVDFDNFVLTESSTITGFSLASKFFYPAEYTSTSWYLWSSRPSASFIPTPLKYGQVSATLQNHELFTNEVIALPSSFMLSPGTYWVGFTNKFRDGFSAQFYVGNSPLPGGAGQLDISAGLYVDDRSDFAFTVEGTSNRQPVIPEPASITLLGIGVSSLAAILRKRRSR